MDLFSSLHIAIIVLEELNEVFEDIVTDSSLYQVAVLSGPVYKTFLDAASILNVNDLESESSSDSDCY